MKEERLFPPPADFAAKARIRSLEQYECCGRRRPATSRAFGELAGELHWFKPYEQGPPVGGCRWPNGSSAARPTCRYNCLDVHLGTPRQQQGGLHLGGRTRRHPRVTYQMLHARGVQVRQRAQVAGHRPRRRGGALHADGSRAAHRHAGLRGSGPSTRVVFGGFSAEAIADRNNDAAAKLLITADAGWRRGKHFR